MEIEIVKLTALREQNAELIKLLQNSKEDTSINLRQAELVRIVVTKSKGRSGSFYVFLAIYNKVTSKGNFGPKEFADLWTKLLLQPADIIDQFNQHRLPRGLIFSVLSLLHLLSLFLKHLLILTWVGRLIYRHKKPVDLQQLAIGPVFWFNKSSGPETGTFNCNILDFNLLAIASIGSDVTVTVTHTHTVVPKSVIDQWFLNLETLYRFELNSLGYKTET